MSYRKVRTKHDKIAPKLMAYIQLIQQSWREKKEKNKKKMCICYITSNLPVKLHQVPEERISFFLLK